MSKFKYLFILLLLLFPFSVFAKCSSSELSRYKTLASNINNYYTYNGNSFDLVLYNVSNELKIVDKNNNIDYYSKYNLGDVFISDISSGTMVNLAVFPLNSNCSDYRVSTIYVNLPYLNTFYTDPICINSTNLLCSKWANTSMYSYEQFVNEVNSSKASEEEKSEPEKPIKKYGFVDFLLDYYSFILMFIIVGGLVVIYYLKKKDSFDF